MFCKNCGKKIKKAASFCPCCGCKLSQSSSKGAEIFCPRDFILNFFATCAMDLLANESDLLVAPNISDSDKAEAKRSFSLDMDDEVLYIRDTSFWNTKNQGLIISKDGVFCVPDNDKPDEKISIYWNSINYTEYKDMCIYFFGYNGREDNVPIHVSFFLKDVENQDLCKNNINLFVSLFTQIGQATGKPVDLEADLEEEIMTLIESKNYEEALASCHRYQAEQGDSIPINYQMSRIFYRTGQYSKSLETIQDVIDQAIHQGWGPPVSFYYFYAVRADCYEALNNIVEARKDNIIIKSFAENQKQKSEVSNNFRILDDLYLQSFLKQNYTQRKLLIPVNEITDLSQSRLSVVDINNLPDIHFPVGHPIANQLYVGHPYIVDQYISFENHELELIDDRVREFCLIMQLLGAMEVTVESINSKTINNDGKVNSTMLGETSYSTSANGSHHKEAETHLVDSIKQSIGLSQKFTPALSPMPDSLVWYPNEASWQRLYQQRMQGGLLEHREKIETRKNRVIQSSELVQVKAELKSLLLAAHATWDKSIEKKIEMQEDAELTIYIRFAPLDKIAPITISSFSSASLLTDDEQEYLEEYKVCIEGGEISAKERRLLDRLYVRLNISETRAKELELLLVPKLTQEEMEYLEEYKACLDEGNVISGRERRLLDRLCDKLCISEMRAIEIEKLK